MPQIQKTITLTHEDKVYDVEHMSDEVKSLVVYIDEWRQKEQDLTGELIMVRAALRDIQNNLITALTPKLPTQP